MKMVVLLCLALMLACGIVLWSHRARAGRISLLILAGATLATLWVHGWRPALVPLYLAAAVLMVGGPWVRRRIDAWQLGPLSPLAAWPNEPTQSGSSQQGSSQQGLAQQGPAQHGRTVGRRFVGIAVRVVLNILSLICVLLTAVTWVAAPPSATGRYSVGTFDWVITDRDRMEVYTQDPSDARKILVRVWYPSEALPDAPDLRAQWLESIAGFHKDYIAPAVADGFMGEMLPPPIGGLIASEMRRLSSPGASGIPIASGAEKFPVLLFSPGYGMPIDLSAAHLAEIASHGYVILGVNITYETSVTQLPDDRVLRQREMVRQDETKGSFVEEQRLGATAGALLPEMIKLMDLPEPQRKVRYLELRQLRMPGEQFLVAAIDQRVLDLQRVLTELEHVAAGQPRNLLSGRVDLGRVGVFGMSLGGPTAGQFCLVDTRCQAGLNYDGEIWGEQLTRMDARVPFMWMRGPVGSKQGEAYSLGIPYVFESSTAPAYYVVIDEMDHMYFTDLAFLMPVVNWLGLPLGKMLSAPDYVLRGRQTALDYTVAFFDRYLKQQDSPLLDDAADSASAPGLGRAAQPGKSSAHVDVKFQQRNVVAAQLVITRPSLQNQ